MLSRCREGSGGGKGGTGGLRQELPECLLRGLGDDFTVLLQPPKVLKSQASARSITSLLPPSGRWS